MQSEEKTVSPDDYELVSSAIGAIGSFEDDDVLDMITNELNSMELTASEKEGVPSNCEELYNLVSSILTYGYNVCYTDSSILDFDFEE